MVKRYELSKEQYQRVGNLLPGKAGDPGRTTQDNRRFINEVLRSGAHWHHLPGRYGNRKSLPNGFLFLASSLLWLH